MASQPQPDPERTTAAAGRLAAALEEMAGQLAATKAELAAAKKASEARDDALTRYGRANRHRIWLSYALLAADVILTVLVVVFAVQSGNASSRADSAVAIAGAQHAEQVSGCENGNQYRAGVVASLNRLVALLEGPHPTARVQKEARAYEAYVLSQNMPRDCARAYALPKGGAAGGTG